MIQNDKEVIKINIETDLSELNKYYYMEAHKPVDQKRYAKLFQNSWETLKDNIARLWELVKNDLEE